MLEHKFLIIHHAGRGGSISYQNVYSHWLVFIALQSFQDPLPHVDGAGRGCPPCSAPPSWPLGDARGPGVCTPGRSHCPDSPGPGSAPGPQSVGILEELDTGSTHSPHSFMSVRGSKTRQENTRAPRGQALPQHLRQFWIKLTILNSYRKHHPLLWRTWRHFGYCQAW